MPCTNFKDLEGCGRCIVNLSNSQKIKYLSVISISQIVDSLFNFCINNSDKKLLLESSYVTCSGSMTLFYSTVNKENHMYRNRTVCRQFIKSWYDYHKIILYDVIVFLYLSRILSILKSISSEKEMVDEAMKLNELLEQLVDDNYG